ncbi:hypothetical protein D3C71_256740 [compost metagenome]
MQSLHKLLIALGAAAVLGSCPQAHAQSAAMIRATCTQKGMTVYREDIPADASAERRLSIASRNPQAMCVFLKIADMPPERRVPASDDLPDEVLRGALEGGSSPDESLAAALSVLSGPSDRPGSTPSVRDSFSNAFAQPMVRGSSAEDRPRPLNLTIGIYRSVPMESIMAHWRSMQAGTKVLARMTPSMAVVGDVTMLSIENVPDDDAAELCQEAEKVGSGCIAVY